MAHFYLPDGSPPDLSRSLRLRPIVEVISRHLEKPPALPPMRSPGHSRSSGFLCMMSEFSYYFSSNLSKSRPKLTAGCSSLMAIGFVGTSQLNHLLLKRFTSQEILRTGLLGMTNCGLRFFNRNVDWDAVGLTGNDRMPICFSIWRFLVFQIPMRRRLVLITLLQKRRVGLCASRVSSIRDRSRIVGRHQLFENSCSCPFGRNVCWPPALW